MPALDTLSAITVGIDPTIELGSITLAWHGLAIAAGVLVGSRPAARYARERGLEPERLASAALVMALAGMVGARLQFLAETDGLLRPERWLGTRGFSFNGALIMATAAIAMYLWLRRLSPRYLDAVAVGFPLGMAIGRIGDVINGEHTGPPTDAPWGLRYPHPDAEAPTAVLAYHSGGLYELLIAAAIFAVAWPLRHRLRHPTMMVWAVLALYAVGRFFEFFYRLDSPEVALGLSGAQWTSLGLFAAAALGMLWAARAGAGKSGGGPGLGSAQRRQAAT